MSRSIIQPMILRELESGPQTDQTLAGKLQTTVHGVRASCNALLQKGKIKKIKNQNGPWCIYKLAP